MFNESDAPQPPKVLNTPLEIAANLRQLQESHDPLIITFHDRSQRFQSYVVHVDRESNTLALDELTRQRLLAALHSEGAHGPRDRLTPPKDTAEVPRDYAPKVPNSPGMLDESYGLKR